MKDRCAGATGQVRYVYPGRVLNPKNIVALISAPLMLRLGVELSVLGNVVLCHHSHCLLQSGRRDTSCKAALAGQLGFGEKPSVAWKHRQEEPIVFSKYSSYSKR